MNYSDCQISNRLNKWAKKLEVRWEVLHMELVLSYAQRSQIPTQKVIPKSIRDQFVRDIQPWFSMPPYCSSTTLFVLASQHYSSVWERESACNSYMIEPRHMHIEVPLRDSKRTLACSHTCLRTFLPSKQPRSLLQPHTWRLTGCLAIVCVWLISCQCSWLIM